MPPATQQTANPPTTPQNLQTRNASTISEIDLSQVPVAELCALRDKIDALLSRDMQRIGDNDLVLDYAVKLITKDGVISRNEGVHRLNAILHPRLLSEAPGRFETAFIQNVFSPVNADAYDLFDSSSNIDSPLAYIKSQTAGAAPNLALPGMGMPGIIPGE